MKSQKQACQNTFALDFLDRPAPPCWRGRRQNQKQKIHASQKHAKLQVKSLEIQPLPAKTLEKSKSSFHVW